MLESTLPADASVLAAAIVGGTSIAAASGPTPRAAQAGTAVPDSTHLAGMTVLWERDLTAPLAATLPTTASGDRWSRCRPCRGDPADRNQLAQCGSGSPLPQFSRSSCARRCRDAAVRGPAYL